MCRPTQCMSAVCVPWVVAGVSDSTVYHSWELFFFSAIGILGGLFGAAFVALNVRIGLCALRCASFLCVESHAMMLTVVCVYDVWCLNRCAVKWRRTHVNPRPWRRVCEILALSILVSFICFFLPFIQSCQPVPSAAGDSSSSGSGSNSGSSSSSDYMLETVQFNCGDNQYNSMASLIFAGLSQALKNLFSRGTAQEFSLVTLFVFGVMYFGMTAVVAGSVAPAGTGVLAAHTLCWLQLMMDCGLGRVVGWLQVL
jgi:hypothetical protein